MKEALMAKEKPIISLHPDATNSNLMAIHGRTFPLQTYLKDDDIKAVHMGGDRYSCTFDKKPHIMELAQHFGWRVSDLAI